MVQANPIVVSQLSSWDASNPSSVTSFVLLLSSASELLLFCIVSSYLWNQDMISSLSPVTALCFSWFTIFLTRTRLARRASCLGAWVMSAWFSVVVLEMYRDVPANSGMYVTAKGHTRLAQAVEPLLLLNVAHGGGSKGKWGMFWLILRTKFNFPCCNSFMNQKGKCVTLSVYLELFIFRALYKHSVLLPSWWVVMESADCSVARSEYNFSPWFFYCCDLTCYFGHLDIK